MTQIVKVTKESVEKAAKSGFENYCRLFADEVLHAVGGNLTAEGMSRLNAEQITLAAYMMFRSEVLEGGFIQLIHNGYGPFIFKNPFAKAMRVVGADEFAKILNKAHREYARNGELLTRECNDEKFMALYEQYPGYDKYDDYFVEHEPEITEAFARYIDAHIERFARVV